MTFDWQRLAQIFITFLKIGPVTFGGGYAMIPSIEKEIVDRREWMTTEDITDVFAIVESAPGAIAINSAIYIGYKVGHIKGAIAALIGILLPTFTIVIILSMLLFAFQDNPYVESAFTTIRVTVVALIAFAAYKIGQVSIIDRTTKVIAVLTLVILLTIEPHPILVIISGAMIGILIYYVKRWFSMSREGGG